MPIAYALLGVRATGPRIRRKPGQGLIVASNHQSWIDPFVVQTSVMPHQITFLMTEIFYDMPVLGLYFRACGARPIREGGPSVAGLRAARDALNDGEAVCFFPEGGITTTGEVGNGQRGVARLARRTGAAVVPVGIHGAIRVLSKIQKTPRLARVSVRRGAAMHYDESDDRDGEQRFTERLMAIIRSLAE